jgi:hypothetical protein
VVVPAASFNRSGGFGGNNGYHFTGGVAQAWKGVEVLVENGGTQPADELLGNVRGYIDSLSDGERKLLTQVEVPASPCPMDDYWRKRYGIPDYYVRALTGGGVTQLWRGNTRTQRVFHHEQAHLLDFAGYVPGSKWSSAMHSDDTALTKLTSDGWKLTDLPVDSFDFERDHLRLTPGGITGYAEFARTNGHTNQEDVAESVAWYKLSNRVGPIARASNAAGETKDLTFADLFPERTKLVQSALSGIAHGDRPTAVPAGPDVPVE